MRDMSRIQNILEKAEREGGVRRMRTLVETAPLPARPVDTAAIDVAAPPAPSAAAPSAAAPATEWVVAAPPAAAPAPAARVVGSTRLDPALIAVLAPGAPAAEQCRALRTRLSQSDRGTA